MVYTLSLLYYLSGHEYTEFHAPTYDEVFEFLKKFHVHAWCRIDSITQVNPNTTEIELSYDLNCDCFDGECSSDRSIPCLCNPEGKNFMKHDYKCVITCRSNEEFQAEQEAKLASILNAMNQ